MAQVYSSPLRVRYTAPFLSAANLFRFLSYIVVIFVSFYLAYNSGALWRKQGKYREQPKISFRHESILILDTFDSTTSQHGTKFWSTFPTLNDAISDNEFIPALIRVQEADSNRDGSNDIISLGITVPISNGLQVHGATTVFFVEFLLNDQIALLMNVPIIVKHESPMPGSYLEISGNLEYWQSQPLYRLNSNADYEAPPTIPDPISSYNNFDLTEWLASYTSRNDTVVFNSDRFPLWRKGTSAQFELNITCRIPTQTISYFPGFSEIIKFAWIQFASIAVLLYLVVIELVGGYVYSEQVLQTNVRKDDETFQDFYRF